MTVLDYPKAIILGIIQGLTEFLPVSSSAHLAIFQRLMHLDPDSHTMLLFDVSVHVGTVASMFWVFSITFARYGRRLVLESSSDYSRRRTGWRIAALGAIATAVTGAIGLGFKNRLEDTFDDPFWIGGGLIITGILLFVAQRLPRPRKGWRQFGFGGAVLVGLAQAISILPGISRSGATICTAMALGLKRRWSAEFSFFIAMPAIGGAVLVKLKDTWELGSDAISVLPIGPILLGTLVSAVAGALALRALLNAVRKAQLDRFAVYCCIVGAAAWVLLRPD